MSIRKSTNTSKSDSGFKKGDLVWFFKPVDKENTLPMAGEIYGIHPLNGRTLLDIKDRTGRLFTVDSRHVSLKKAT